MGEQDGKSPPNASKAVSFVSILLCAFVVVRVELVSQGLVRTDRRVEGFDQRLSALEKLGADFENSNSGKSQADGELIQEIANLIEYPPMEHLVCFH